MLLKKLKKTKQNPKMSKKINSLYIHIPFCTHICRYCDFTKLFYNKKFSEPYLRALFSELDSYNIELVNTIYIGGGTPTSLSDEEFEGVLKKVSPLLINGGEFSVEANVENLTKTKLELMKKYQVNRLSLGVESTCDKCLKQIGRAHSFEEAKKAVELAKSYGFDNINVDLMFGFPGQNIDDLRNDLNNIIALNTQHISIYSLIVSPGTAFFNDGIKEQNEDSSRLFYDEILQSLRSVGYKRYEVSNFAKKGKESRHNLTYWQGKEYYGIGLGASGYIDGARYTNTKNIDSYINGKYVDVAEEVTDNERLEDFLLCNLRLEEGFLRKDFSDRFGIDFATKYKAQLPELTKNNLIIIENDRIKLSDDGIAIMDYILLKLL